MKLGTILGWSSALCLSLVSSLAQAQETNSVEKFELRLKEIQENFDRQQREMKENFERMLRAQQSQIEALKKQIAATPTNAPAPTLVSNAPPATLADDVDDLKHQVDELTTFSKRTSVSQFNPGIGFAADTIFSYTSKGQGA